MRIRRMAVVSLTMIALLFFMFIPSSKSYLTSKTYPVFRNYEEGRLADYTKNYKMQEKGRISVYYLDADQAYAQKVMLLGEKDLNELEKFFSYKLGKVNIVVYSSKDAMYAQLGISPDSRVMGAYYGGRLNILSPRIWYQEGYVAPGDDSQLSNTVLHEMTHLLVDEMAHSNFPTWFTEGAALYMEYVYLDYEWAGDIKQMTFYPMSTMEDQFSSLDENLAYKQSFLLTKHMIEKMGKDKYLQLIQRLGQGMDFQSSVSKIYGLNIQQLADEL